MSPSVVQSLLGHSSAAMIARYYRGAAEAKPEGGREALAGLSASLLRIRSRTDRALLRAYRVYLARTVVAASPLLLDACAWNGLNVDVQAGRMRPDGEWPAWLWGYRAAVGGRAARRSGTTPGALLRELDEVGRLRRFVRSGLVLLREDDPPTGLGMRALDGYLDLALVSASCRIHTTRGRATMRLQATLPATIVSAMPGRAVDAVVSHPLTDGRDYRIRYARNHISGGTTIVFDAEPVEWRMSWSEVVRRPKAKGADDAVLLGPGWDVP